MLDHHLKNNVEISEYIHEKSNFVLDICRQAGLKLATAESCTGGMIAAALTAHAGSSDVVERGFVTYSNEAKMDLLGVPAPMLKVHGAVSRQVAIAMVEGALDNSRADLAVAVTGIAGPAGGSPEKPVGLVHIAGQREGVTGRHWERRYGDVGRDRVRLLTVCDALDCLAGLANGEGEFA